LAKSGRFPFSEASRIFLSYLERKLGPEGVDRMLTLILRQIFEGKVKRKGERK